ncbi:restriction endonuclease [uncultured Acinetobacter sp.]|uniref:restriction endonuclease n=1 Tax=uncultured Acinetobacter sp. TaxID=165433 RepID=UPI0025F63F1B|nr:restriction endonuclease [uncultured Acinetobacter sp.]
MYEIQKYSQALEQSVTFPIEIAQQILGVIEAVFGVDFERVHGATDAEILIETFRVVLDGLTPTQIQNGVKNMRSEKWCPTLSEFRRLCLQDDSWWSAEMAWAMSLNWNKNNSKPITTLARKTLNDVSEILKTQGQKAAYKAFIETYEYNLRTDKKLGKVQVIWTKPQKSEEQINSQNNERNRTGTPCPPDLLAKIKHSVKSTPSTAMQQHIAKGHSPLDAFQIVKGVNT